MTYADIFKNSRAHGSYLGKKMQETPNYKQFLQQVNKVAPAFVFTQQHCSSILTMQTTWMPNMSGIWLSKLKIEPKKFQTASGFLQLSYEVKSSQEFVTPCGQTVFPIGLCCDSTEWSLLPHSLNADALFMLVLMFSYGTHFAFTILSYASLLSQEIICRCGVIERPTGRSSQNSSVTSYLLS